MITEDYVSFEIAKLLKEKGFNEPIWTRYEDNNEVIFGDKYNWNNSPMGQISAPTLQMTMKWLREVHRLSIELFVDYGIYDEFWWSANVGKIKKDEPLDTLMGYSSYEDACKSAIKYCLENLI